MSAILFLERRDFRNTPSYIDELMIAGHLPKGVSGAEFLGNSSTPNKEETVEFYQNQMRYRPDKVLVKIPGEGLNLDRTPNGATVYVAIDKQD